MRCPFGFRILGRAIAVAVAALLVGPRAIAADGAEDAALAREATLPALLSRALARSPDLAAEKERSLASSERVDGAGRLPTLELKYEVWSVPFAHPVAFDQAMMHMVGFRQAFPAFGTRAARARGAQAEAEIARATLDARKEDLIANVRRSFAEYRAVEEEERIRLESAGLLSRLGEVANRNYQTGGALQDQLRIEAELVREHTEISSAMQRRRTAGALLNALVGRAPETPLGPPAGEPSRQPEALPQTAAKSDSSRPEIAAAEKDVDRSDAALEAARRSASYPDFMVGLDYMNQPTQIEAHGYGAMVSMTLPWLNPAKSAAERAEARNVTAAQEQAASVRLTVEYEMVAARERYRTAREVQALVEGRSVPVARRSYELAEQTYGTGKGDLTVLLDAWRAYLLARLDQARAVAQVDIAGADLDRAAGAGRAFAERATGGPR